jgi:hypothetical protein
MSGFQSSQEVPAIHGKPRYQSAIGFAGADAQRLTNPSRSKFGIILQTNGDLKNGRRELQITHQFERPLPSVVCLSDLKS